MIFLKIKCKHCNESQIQIRIEIYLLTSTSVAVSESPLSLPSGKSCSSAANKGGSSTDCRDVDFWDGMLRLERLLIPDWDRGNIGDSLLPLSASVSASDFRLRVAASFRRLREGDKESGH
jgi:hypothetical protein